MIDESDIPLMDKEAPTIVRGNSGETIVREVWDLLKYLDYKADKIGDLCRLDKAELESLRYANEQLDHAENMIGDIRNQIERPILESEE
jgi:hypothetical protein